ncbi:MAG: ribose-phosphate pyrophosphokinase, partial [Nitrospinota bacterium]|nr:ribose-phosphate pyrophosphokinase [Nitrospinota bacterium]
MNKQLLLFSGRSNLALSKEISKYLKISLGQSSMSNFSDGEIMVKIKENVRGRDVFIIQSTCYPGNDNLMELLIMIDAIKRSSASRITAVIPYYGYARQDRKVEPRVPITSKLVADLIYSAGASRLLTVDLHAGQIQGFFDIPVDNLFATPIFTKHIKRKIKNKNLICVAPDVGGVERARALGRKLNAELAIIDKRRDKPGVANAMHIIGNVKNKNVFIVDDMIDTAGTITEATQALMESGARAVYATCTHPVLSGPAVERLSNSNVKQVL